MGKVRKFLRPVEQSDIDGNAAGGETILVQLANGTEIGGAEESGPIILAPVEFRLIAETALLEAEAGESAVFWKLPRRAVSRHVEAGWVVLDLVACFAGDDMHPDGNLEVLAEMEEGDRKWSRSLGEECAISVKLDLAVCLIVDPLQNGARR